MKDKYTDNRVKVRKSPIRMFAITFVVLSILTTIQNIILGSFIDYTAVSPIYIVLMVGYWLVVSMVFALFTRWQITRSYDKPLHRFAKATGEVANGDFSVYVRPLHTKDKADYLDVMIEDFNIMVAELGSIETLKTEFFSNVSHEIKTPLATIQNYAQMLNKSNLTKEQKEYIDSIIESTKKLDGLIVNILKLNKLEQQKIQSVPKPYDLCAQLSECALQFETTWEEKDITFEFDIEDRATIEADSDLMELVWNNLLSNALKFTSSGGTVTLTQTSEADNVVVCVSDTGCGMDEKTTRHIFDKFYQGDTSHATEGNGLGLSLALRVLQLSGGSIAVKSEPGQGSVFTVQLPVSYRKNLNEGDM